MKIVQSHWGKGTITLNPFLSFLKFILENEGENKASAKCMINIRTFCPQNPQKILYNILIRTLESASTTLTPRITVGKGRIWINFPYLEEKALKVVFFLETALYPSPK